MLQKTHSLSLQEKYALYESSVQCSEGDIDFISTQFRKICGRTPITLREDFGGTGMLACEWVKQSHLHKSWAIDLDEEPIKYGMENHYSKLSSEEKKRMTYLNGDVLDSHGFTTDVIVAFNFSYYIFKERNKLVHYFKKVRESLNENGALFLDLFGGTDAREPHEEETEYDNYSYIWDCEKYNPITHESLYYIHFKKDDTIYRNVFTYNWRHWSLAELRDVLHDAGFRKTLAYWEGEDEDGDGDGDFYVTEDAENCESWVTYIMALN